MRHLETVERPADSWADEREQLRAEVGHVVATIATRRSTTPVRVSFARYVDEPRHIAREHAAPVRAAQFAERESERSSSGTAVHLGRPR